MDSLKKLEKSNRVAFIVTLILVVFSMICCIIGFPKGDVGTYFNKLSDVAVDVLILAYALWGYKKPHGNLLRCTFFIFGAMVMLKCIFSGTRLVSDTLQLIVNGITGLAAIIITYISGRLNKIEKNKRLMVFVGILLLACSMIVIFSRPIFTFRRIITLINHPVCWTALCFIYIARFEQHKAAGLEDKA